MKSKQKGQVNTRQSYQSLTSNKSQLRTNNKKQQFANHIPLSSTQHVDLGSRNKLTRYNQDVLGHSPYTSLPSIGNQNIQLRYRESPYQEAQKRVKIKYNHDSRYNDSTSIYDRLQLGSVNKSVKSQSSSTKQNNPDSLNYQTKAKESNIYSNNKFTKVNGNRNVGYFYDPGQGQQQQLQEGLGQRQGSIQMNRMKRDISSKLERVCEKVENLSREKVDNEGNRGQVKKNRCDKHNRSDNKDANTIKFNNNISKRLDPSTHPNLCYSNLVYQPLPQNSPQHPTPSNPPSHQYQLNYQQYQNQQNDNQIMCKVVASQEERYKRQLDFLQERVIELNRKVIASNVKIAGLEEDLLNEKQKFITKEKQWLQREHQLLKCIQDNASDISFSHQGSSPEKPSHHQYSNPPNIILLNHKPLQPLNIPSIPNLPTLLTLTTSLLTKTHQWLNLMNRSPSSQLPGTAFRVKQEMNLNINQLQQLRSLCQNIASNANCHNNVTNNQSQVFLLQSYCPPEQYQISTKRHCSIHKIQGKPSSKSLLALSESKSTTNHKKAHLTSTQKKSYRKGTGKQNRRDLQEGDCNDRARFQKQIVKSTRRLDYYCHDEVFYVEEGNGEKDQSNYSGKLNQVNDKINLTDTPNIIDQDQLEHHYYQLLTLQAITIESLINQSLPQSQQQQQQILL